MNARSIGVMTVLNGIGALLTVGQSAVVAYFFGTTRGVEIYFAAVGVELSVGQMLQTGKITAIFLPIYHRLKHNAGVSAAYGAFAVLVNWLLLLVLPFCIAMYFCAPLLVRLRVPGFSPGDLQTATRMFQALVPLLGIHVTVAMFQLLANAEKWFGLPEALAVAGRVVSIAIIALMSSNWSNWSLVAALYANNLLMLSGMFLLIYRLGYRHRFHLRQSGFHLRSVLGDLRTTFVYVVLTQVYLFAFDAGLSQLPQGVYGVFKYVQRQLFSRTSAIALQPVGVVFFTHFSEAVARGSAAVVELARRALNLTLAISVLICVAFVVGGRMLLESLWSGPQFGAEEITMATHLATALYLLLLAAAADQVYRRMVMSLGLVRQYFWTASLVQCACAVLSLLILPQGGVYGALSIVAVNMLVLSAAPLLLILAARPEMAAFYSLAHVLRWAAAAAAGICIGLLIVHFPPFNVEPAGRWLQFLCALGLGGVAVLVTIASAWLLGDPEVRRGTRRLCLAVTGRSELL